MQQLDTDLLAQLVRAKHACLLRLRDMGGAQFEMIRQGNMTALLDVLSAKQRPLGELQRVERALDPYRAQAPHERRWRTAEQRAACARQLDECETLLREIVQQEKQSEAALAQRRDDTAHQLQGMHLAGQARGAYTALLPDTIHQIDLSCER